MGGLTYLCVDPVLKRTIMPQRAASTVQSLESGGDLKGELKPFVNAALKTAAAILICVAIFSAPSTLAASTNAPAMQATGRTIAPPDLDHAINRQTIHESNTSGACRASKPSSRRAGNGIIAKFFQKIKRDP